MASWSMRVEKSVLGIKASWDTVLTVDLHPLPKVTKYFRNPDV